MSNFDPSKLGQRADRQPASQGPKAERVFLIVNEYVTPAEGFHYAVGVRADNPEEHVRVRLNTVNERAADRPKDNIEKIKAQYVSGENTRESIADKGKAGIKLLSFDDARLIGRENGISEYRAHWPKTISTSQDAEVLSGLAHIKLKDPEPQNGAKGQAYVELIKSQTIVDANNIDAILKDALETRDNFNRARDPVMIIRALHEGKVVASPRMYPSFETVKVFDQNLGDYKDASRKQNADKTIENLLSAKQGNNDFTNRSLDTVRALVAGVKGNDEPVLNSPDPGIRDSIRNLYYGAKAGAIQIEIIAAEKIDFGPDSRKTYLSNKNQSHLEVYNIKQKIDENRERQTPGYAQTVVGIHRHPDGEPYAVFASPKDMWPKPIKLSEVPINPVVKKEISVGPTIQRPEPESIELEEIDYAYEP